jgi:hypothetical protein
VILLAVVGVLAAGLLAYRYQLSHHSQIVKAEITYWDQCSSRQEAGVCVKYRFTYLDRQYTGSGQISMQEWSRTEKHIDVRFLPAFPSLNEPADSRRRARASIYPIAVVVVAISYAVAYGIRLKRAPGDRDRTHPLGLDTDRPAVRRTPMERKCFVKVSIRTAEPGGFLRDLELGEFLAVWTKTVSIGSDPGCTVVLPDLPPVAVRVVAASNHKLLYRLPEGTRLPLPPVTSPLPEYDNRVDYRAFTVGPYLIQFGEVYRVE